MSIQFPRENAYSLNASSKILLVEDDPGILEDTQRVLEAADYEVLTGQNGFQGLELARTYHPDLVLVEVNMPDMSGLEVCHQIKQLPDLQNTFVMILSGSATDSESSAIGLEAGADGYISRPISNRELIVRVETMLRIRNAEAALRQAQAETQELLERSEKSRRALLSLLEDRQRAEAAIQRRNAELTALNQIGQALNKLAKPAEILELIFAVIGQVLDNRNLYIALFDETKQSISFPIYLINGKRMEDRDRPMGNGITDYIIRNNTPILVRRDLMSSFSRLGIRPVGTPSRSYLGVPMLAGDKVIGVIALQDYQQDNVYDRQHLELLMTIAAQATVALENARLYSAVQQELEERKQAEEKLRQSEERYRRIVETAKEGIIAFDTSWRVSFANVRMAEILGYDQDEILGIHIDDFVFEDDFTGHKGRKALREAGFAGAHEGMYRTKSGAPVWMLLSITPVLEEGKFAGIFMMATDITERKRAELAQQESERRYRALFEDSPIAIWEEDFSSLKKYLDTLKSQGVTDFRGYFDEHPEALFKAGEMIRILDVNNAGVKVFGAQSKEELIRQTEKELSPGEEENLSELLAAIAEGRTSHSWEGIDTTMMGEPLDINLTWSVIPGHEEDFSKVIVTTIDITERKRAEKLLIEGEKRYRTTLNNMMEGCQIIDHDWRYIYVNDAAAKQWRSAPEKLLMRTMMETYPGIETTDLFNILRHCMEARVPQRMENQFIFPDGTTSWFELGVQPVPEGLFILSIDITERKRAEEAIRLSEKKFKTLFEIAPVGISVMDRKGKIIDANYALQMITGLRNNKILNRSYHKRTYLRPDGTIMPPDEFASTRALKENMPIFDVETGIVTEDRGVVWTQISAAPLEMPDASLVVVTQDISERKQTEQALRRRLAELETLYESGLSLNQLLEPKEIGQKIIAVLAEKLDWNHTTVRLYHPESESLELLAYNIAENITEQELLAIGERFRSMIARPGDGLSGWVLQHAETVRCSDTLRDPRYIETVPGLRSGLYVPIKTGERAIGVISIESEKPDFFTPEDEHLAVTLAAQAAVALENIRLFKDLQKSNESLLRAYDRTIEGWSHALDLRDKETEGHTQRVTILTEELARVMGVSEAEIVHIRWGALLHDIGKMGVPDRILLKPDKLTDDEWVIMRQHPVHAFNLLSRIDFLQPALTIPHHHHERWDGSGYPDGLHGEQIPLEARIFAVIDVYDALTSDRPYRPAWPENKALPYIREQSGIHFDPQVVDVFLKQIKRK